MTKTEFNKKMEIWGDRFFEDTCDKLSAEIVRKIMNCKAIDDFNKMTILSQYMKNLSTNECIVEAIKYYNNR